MSTSRIRIGVYGATGSGKTSFFQRLVQINALPVKPGSKLAQFMGAAVGPDGRVVPTTTHFDNIEIKIDGIVFELGDWKGEIQSEAVDRLDMENRQGWSRNLMAREVARSDVFLFFFNPAFQGSTARVHKHFNEELLRAKQLIDYVLTSRQNRLLPILFVLGYQERGTTPPELASMTEQWIGEVDEYLGESYSQLLLGYYPRALVRRENVFHRISPTASHQGDDLLGVMEKSRSLLELAGQFRQRDRKRSLRLVVVFLVCMLLILLIPLACLSSPAAQRFLRGVQDRAAPVFDSIPSFTGPQAGSREELSENAEELEPLWNTELTMDRHAAARYNKDLRRLQDRLVKLDAEGRADSEEYRLRLGQWTRSFEAIDRRLDRPDTETAAEEKLRIYATLLALLADPPNQATPALGDAIRKFWTFYRETMVAELRADLAVHRAAGAPPAQILQRLCQRFDRHYRYVSQESNVRGSAFQGTLEKTDENRKEQLVRDIHAAYIACRNYQDRYPVDVRIRGATYESSEEFDRDYDYRLVFRGGLEKGDVEIDLTPTPGYEKTLSCSFLPSRSDVVVSLPPDQPLMTGLQRRFKSSESDWEELCSWRISSDGVKEPSLEALGLHFYLRYENEENTLYIPGKNGFRFELLLRRPRAVPQLLWDIATAAEP